MSDGEGRSNLTTFGANVSTANERLEIWFVGGGVYALVFQSEQTLANLEYSLLSDCETKRFEGPTGKFELVHLEFSRHRCWA